MSRLFATDDEPFSLERRLIKDGFRYIAGIDEVGRGALAGPVVAAAVILSDKSKKLIGRVRDSKKLTPEKREGLYPEICDTALSVGIGIVEADEIDRINILQATFQAMLVAVGKLSPAPDLCLVDGTQRAPLAVSQLCIVKGDDRVLSIGAASIIAKVTRDRMMVDLAKQFPDYRFDENKGYGTSPHYDALRKEGLSPIHRKTFVHLSP